MITLSALFLPIAMISAGPVICAKRSDVVAHLATRFGEAPLARGLAENGVTFVLENADQYKELAKNDLDEMSLASPAIAGGAIYIRTETKVYKIM